MKTCTKCGITKPLIDYYYRKDSNTYRNECKECIKHAKALREAQPGVKEERARKERERRLNHKDRINETLRKQRSTYLKDKVLIQSKNNCFKRKSKLKDGITTSELIAWQSEQVPTCVYCGTTKLLSIDHIVPLSKNGTHTADNLVLACKSCNSSKNNNSLIYWLATKTQLTEVKDKKP